MEQSIKSIFMLYIIQSIIIFKFNCLNIYNYNKNEDWLRKG
jgi:hypothetical protein